jgi:enoyl-CoA hydratase
VAAEQQREQGMTEHQLVELRLDEHEVAWIRLVNAAQRNVLSTELSWELARVVAGAVEAGAGALVLVADPPVFCSGGSLDGLLRRDAPLEEAYRGFEALFAAPIPTIAAVGSPVIGAGINLPLACDVVLTSPGATFDPRFLDVGIHPGGGCAFKLIERVGAQGAAALLLMGDTIDGEEAAVAGLAWRCVPSHELEERAAALARRAAGRPRALVERTKQTLRRSLELSDFEQAATLELEAQAWSMEQPGFNERIVAIKASLDRRKASS